MEGGTEAGHYGRVAGVFAFVFGELAGVVVEGPLFGDLCCHKLDDDVAGAQAGEVVGKVCADAE